MRRELWTVAYRNLARNRRRNFATGVAIALGFAALLALGGYVNRVENYLRVYTIYATRVGHVTVYQRDGLDKFSVKPRDFSLGKADAAKLEAIGAADPNVRLQGGQLLGAGLIGNGCKTLPFIATGLDPQLDRALRQHPEMVRWDVEVRRYSKGKGLAEYPVELGPVALSTGLARLLGKTSVHDDFNQEKPPLVIVDCMAPDFKKQVAMDANVQLAAGSWDGMMSALDGEVVAQYSTGITETNNAAILAPLAHLQKLYDTDNVTYWSYWLKDESKLEKTQARLTEEFNKAGLDVDVYPWFDERMAPFYTGTMQFLHVMVGFISFVLASIVVFSIFNSATMTVLERAQEIGMMRSLGFTRQQIRLLFVRENLILSLMALAAGGALAVIGMRLVNLLDIRFTPPGVAGSLKLMLTPNLTNIGLSLVVVLVLSLATTWWAVASVAKRNIANLVLGTQR